jgi:hypothetical protein
MLPALRWFCRRPSDRYSMPHYNTFIVRIWTNENGGFHGEVTHVASQETRGFRELGRMMQFMVERIQRPEDQTGSNGAHEGEEKP